MKKTETYTKDVYYCDICGAKIENNVRAPYTVTHYQAKSEYSDEPIKYEHEECSHLVDLCSYHSHILGALMAERVKEALSFLSNKQKLIEIIKQKEMN